MIDYEEWEKFYKKFGNTKFQNDETDFDKLKVIDKEFKILSQEYFKDNFDVQGLSDIWCNIGNMTKNNNTYQDYFNDFIGYLDYSSDRMNYNRWLYCRLSLSEACNIVYQQYKS